ncbi:MAG: CPBP family intramembrane metalloprotease [Verrucomicrobia bacterium]|nr:CPBP family intramembrane metalloprotease [Verrucomicrobiota bacterium]
METFFTHATLWKNPLATLTFFAFGMSFVSLWFRKTAWLWGSFLAISTFLAFQAGIVTPVGLIPILIVMVFHFLMKKEIKRWGRLFLFALVSIISLGLAFHLFPGFHNWQVASNLAISPQAYPYNLWFNFDKPFIGIFALAWTIPLIQSRVQFQRVTRITIPLSILGIALMMLISLNTGLVKWDPKIPTILFVWLIDNLVFVAIPEEAFFRGFFQKEVKQWLGQGRLASFGAVLGTSLFFTLLHVKWVPSIPFLCLVFVAGLIYGTIYEITKSIESSIFCHFALNAAHFLLFTYPALKDVV